jgi:phage tail protein X
MEVPSPRPFTDVLTVPAATRSLERPVAVVTVQTEDTLLWLLSSVYGRVDETVIDVVQLANPSVALPRAGERLSLPPVKSATMVHMLDDGRYVVHLLTTSDPADRRLRRLRPDILASGRKIRLVPVRLWTGCEACYRVWVGEFESRSEAEAFYRHVRPWDAA